MSRIVQQAVTLTSTTQKAPLGSRYFDEESGKVYYYAKANEALVLGDCVVPLYAEADGDCDASSGKQFNDAAATFTTAMVGSFIKINAGTIDINQKPNRIASFVSTILVLMEDEWGTALTTSEDYVIYNPWKVEAVDAAAEKIVGVAQLAVASGSYFWMQSGGLADHVLVKGDGNAIVAGRPIISSGTAGKGFGPTAPPAGDTYNTAAMLVNLKELEHHGIHALVPTALAAQTVPAYLNLLP